MTHISSITPGPGERTIVYGGTRGGKSAVMDWMSHEIQDSRPNCMQVLVDSKPRYRAETERGPGRIGRRSARHRYESWSKGPVVPNSVVIDIWDRKPFRGIWDDKHPGEIAILQSGEAEDWRRMLELLNAFVKANLKGRERFIRVDEVLDFYHRNTIGINAKNDVFLRAFRAGGERGIGTMLGAHQVSGIPPLIKKMSSRIILFHLREDEEMKLLRGAGIRDETSPDGDYVFKHWTVEPGGRLSEPFQGRVTLPDSYLEQLAAT